MTEKIKVPQCLAYWFEEIGGEGHTLYYVLFLLRKLKREENSEVYDWYNDPNTHEFKKERIVTALRYYDYEVEEERFYWRRKECGVFSFEDIDNQYLNICCYFNGKKEVFFSSKYESESCKTKLTTTEVVKLLPVSDRMELERIKVED